MNTTITIEIKAPELAHALETLAIAIGCTVDKIGVGGIIKEAANQTPTVTVTDILSYGGTQQPVHQSMQQAPIQQIPITQQAPVQLMPQQNASVPTQAQAYTMDQLAVAATQLMDAGKRNDLISLLGQFNVPALTALPKDQYGAFATSLRGMGAKI